MHFDGPFAGQPGLGTTGLTYLDTGEIIGERPWTWDPAAQTELRPTSAKPSRRSR